MSVTTHRSKSHAKRKVGTRGHAHSRSSVVRLLRRALPDLLEKYKIKSFGIFGSYARGEQKTTSDLDVLVEYTASPSLTEMLAIEEELSSLVGTKVQVTELQLLRTFIGKNVMRHVIWLQKDGIAQRLKVPRRTSNSKHNGGRMAEPKREYLDFLHDMVESMELAQEYVQGMTFDEMLKDRKTRDSVEHTKICRWCEKCSMRK